MNTNIELMAENELQLVNGGIVCGGLCVGGLFALGTLVGGGIAYLALD
ncbi:hypothetical protein [Microbulbifer sediminum]|nr:hypothetical protein [Microbulbifer sediminum]